MIDVFAAAAACVVLCGLSVVQILAASGMPYGRLVWGGRHEILPPKLRIGSAISVVLYAAIAALLLWRAGVFGPPPGFAVTATWVIFAYFVVGIVMNGISRSRAERAVMTPACVILAACTLVVALG